ncbi:MAG: hypothetical protein P9M14_10865 [Candidatus Alcyoniella australis]|nr:hypothetical protein [Candidatus Alcyoniella australis]
MRISAAAIITLLLAAMLVACGPSAAEQQAWRDAARYIRPHLDQRDVIVADSVSSAQGLLRGIHGDQPLPLLAPARSGESSIATYENLTVLVLPHDAEAIGELIREQLGEQTRFWLLRDERKSRPAAELIADQGLAVDRALFDERFSVTRMLYPRPPSWGTLLDLHTVSGAPPELSGNLVGMLRAPLTYGPQQAALAALKGLIAGLDPTRGMLPWCGMARDSNGWSGSHCGTDWVVGASTDLEGLLLLRRACGSDHGVEAEAALRRGLLGRAMSDGLVYREDAAFSDLEAVIADQASYLSMLATRIELDNAQYARVLVGANVRGLLLRSESGAHGLHLPEASYFPDRSAGWTAGTVDWYDEALLLPGLARASALIDDPLLEQLTNGLAEYLEYESGAYISAGDYSGEPLPYLRGLRGLLIHAHNRSNEALATRVRERLDPLFDAPLAPSMHTRWTEDPDALAELIQIALLLGEQDPRYYEHAEGLARNQLRTCQWPIEADPAVAGSFDNNCAGICRGNQTAGPTTAAVAIARLALSAVLGRDGRCRVNLLCNSADPLLVVLSELPYAGRIVVEARNDCQAELRIPPWATRLTLDNTPVPDGAWSNGYLDLGVIEAGQRRELGFAVPERLESPTDGGLSVLWRGNVVAAVIWAQACDDPSYLGDVAHFEGEAPRGMVNLFVAD